MAKAKKNKKKSKRKHVKPQEALAAKREARETIEKRARDPVIEALLAPPSEKEKSRSTGLPWETES